MLKEMRQALRDLLQPRQTHRAAQVARENFPSGARTGAAEGRHSSERTLLPQGACARSREALQQALERDPQSAALHYELGLVLRGEGQKHAALTSLQHAIALQHDHVPALFHAGQLHAELGDVEQAQDCFGLALAFDPLSSAARTALAQLLAEHRSFDSGIALLSEALEQGNADVAVFCRLAALVAQRGDTVRAAAIYREAIERFGDDPAPLVNLGLLNLGQIGDASEAEALFRRALQLDPLLIEAQANLGLALQEQGRFADAHRLYERLIAEFPGVVEYRWNRGLARLIQGEFAAGWEGYEARKQRADGEIHRNYPFPEWEGTDLAGRRILVYGEQGLGDEVMFSSCLPEILAQAQATVLECDSRLVPLFRRSFPGARTESRIAARDAGKDYSGVDVQSAIGSLPRFLRRHREAFPPHTGYLVADAGKVAAWRERLKGLGTGPSVGIAWRGGTWKTRRNLRSLPVQLLDPLLECDRLRFVSVQGGEREEEREWLEQRYPGRVRRFPDETATIDDLAALVGALDLVISVPSTNIHLAGALGTPAWVLLTRAPEWRYQWRGEDMPWYPSVRLIRQPQAGDWRGVVAQVRDRLERFLAGDARTGDRDR